MIIKYFDEFEGTWIDISGETGASLSYSPSGWTATAWKGVLNGAIRQVGTADPEMYYADDTKVIQGDITATRTGTGIYNINSTSAIFALETGGFYHRQFLGTQTNTTESVTFQIIRQDDYNIKIYTYLKTDLTDGLLDFTSFEFIYY